MNGLEEHVCSRITRLLACVEVFEQNGTKYVRKTLLPPALGAHRPGILAWVPRTLCALEVRALTRLKGLVGVPRIVRQDSRFSFVSLYEECTPVGRVTTLPPEYFDKLEVLLRLIHERGVVDLDLVHEADTMIDRNGNPVVLDFGLGLTFPRERSRIGEKIFSYLCRQHRIHVLEMKSKYFPDGLASEDRAEIHRRFTFPKIQRSLHALRRWVGAVFFGLSVLEHKFGDVLKELDSGSGPE